MHKEERADWRKAFFVSGGMPSAHSALIVATAVTIGWVEGFDSAIFALAFIVTVIVLYDAGHVRRSVGEQGKILRKLIGSSDSLFSKKDAHFKSAEGHLPKEILAGTLIGFAAAVIALYFF